MRSGWVTTLLLLMTMGAGPVEGATQLSEIELTRLREAPRSQWPASLPLQSKTTFMQPTPANVRARLVALRDTPDDAEPLVLHLRTTDPYTVFRSLAKDSLLAKLDDAPSAKVRAMTWADKELGSRIQERNLPLVAQDLRWLDPGKLANILKRPTVQPSVSVRSWQSALKGSLDELEHHFGSAWPAVSRSVTDWLDRNPKARDIPLQAFLPEHIQSLYGKYAHLRGRNCFSTALYFVQPTAIRDRSINVIREPGHHVAMINSDEFLRAMQLGFYEVPLHETVSGLQYGDIIAFYDRTLGPGFPSLKHAFVHVGDGIYFQKPSKSASTPIELAFWHDIVNVWVDLAGALDYAVYRRLPLGEEGFLTPEAANERIFWTPTP